MENNEDPVRTGGGEIIPRSSASGGDGQQGVPPAIHRSEEPDGTPKPVGRIEREPVDGDRSGNIQIGRGKDVSLDRKKRKAGFDVTQKRKLKKNYKAKYKTSDEVIRVKYKPHGAQKKFADLIETGKKITLCIGGRQGGKTYSGAREALKQIYKYKRKPNLGWIISPTYPMSLVVERAFEDAAGFYEQGGLIVRKLAGQRAYILHPPGGSGEPFRVEIKTAENPDRLRGAGVGFIWMDEAAMMSEETYKILLGCILATKGIIFMTSTPRGRNWFYHLFADAEKNPLIGAVRFPSTDNVYLGEQELALMRGQLSVDFARQELEAEFVSFEGLVYRAFNYNRHVIPPLIQLPSGAEVVCGIDNGYADPFVCLWIAKANGKYYVLDEYYEKGRTLESVARSIKSNRWDRHVIRRWADPSGAQERADLDRYGIGTYPARNDIKAGINEVERLIEHGRLLIGQNCINTINEISQYHYEQRDGRNSGEEPVDSQNHAMDALRYALFSECQYAEAHPLIHINDEGELEVIGGNSYLSNKLEDWIHAPTHDVAWMNDEYGY